jgi:hypothetical protein
VRDTIRDIVRLRTATPVPIEVGSANQQVSRRARFQCGQSGVGIKGRSQDRTRSGTETTARDMPIVSLHHGDAAAVDEGGDWDNPRRYAHASANSRKSVRVVIERLGASLFRR